MIANLPVPPTDNLYKFLAIAGLVGLILSCIFPTRWLFICEDEQNKTSEQVAVLLAEEDAASRKIDFVSNIISNSILAQKDQYQHSADKLEVTYSNDEIKAFDAELLDLSATLRVNRAHVKAAIERDSTLVKRVKMMMYWACIAYGLSTIVTTTGFVSWFFFVQIHLDRILRNT
jgi:hypothetical protein